MRLLKSFLRALTRRPSKRPAAPQARPGVESLESRETPSGGLGGGGHVPPPYYLPPGSIVPVQTAPPAPSHGHGGADVPQIKT